MDQLGLDDGTGDTPAGQQAPVRSTITAQASRLLKSVRKNSLISLILLAIPVLTFFLGYLRNTSFTELAQCKADRDLCMGATAQVARVEVTSEVTREVTRVVTRVVAPTSIPKLNLQVNSSAFPFEATPLDLGSGDVVVISSDPSRTWDCGSGAATADGLMLPDPMSTSIMPSVGFCGLIGRIGEGPYFKVGSRATVTVDAPGVLFLGANDAFPEQCAPNDCFADNSGFVIVLVSVTRSAQP